jgi:5-methylcytosine-specific restriction protein A
VSRRRRTTLAPLTKGPNGRNLCRYCRQEVQPPRRTFCGDECVHQYSIRSSPRYARAHVLKRDHGICALCGSDESATGDWQADHVIPVVEGGGECGLLRTLCTPCHKRVTRELAARLARARAEGETTGVAA